jgi:hypothetical protein
MISEICVGCKKKKLFVLAIAHNLHTQSFINFLLADFVFVAGVQGKKILLEEISSEREI